MLISRALAAALAITLASAAPTYADTKPTARVTDCKTRSDGTVQATITIKGASKQHPVTWKLSTFDLDEQVPPNPIDVDKGKTTARQLRLKVQYSSDVGVLAKIRSGGQSLYFEWVDSPAYGCGLA